MTIMQLKIEQHMKQHLPCYQMYNIICFYNVCLFSISIHSLSSKGSLQESQRETAVPCTLIVRSSTAVT